MTRTELRQIGEDAARRVLLANGITARRTSAGVALDFKRDRRTDTIGRGEDLVLACEDAIAISDEGLCEEVPFQALHVAALCAEDPAWLLQCLSDLFEQTDLPAFMESGEDVVEDDDGDGGDVEVGSFDDNVEPFPSGRAGRRGGRG